MNSGLKVAVALCTVVLVAGCASKSGSGGKYGNSHYSTPPVNMSECKPYVKMHGGGMYMAKPVHFSFNKWDVKRKYTRHLCCVAMLSTSPAPMKITLTGHTDSVGSSKYNMELGKWRAVAVKKYLIKRGVEHEQIMVKSAGEAAPARSNETKEGRYYNRRVEFDFNRLIHPEH